MRMYRQLKTETLACGLILTMNGATHQENGMITVARYRLPMVTSNTGSGDPEGADSYADKLGRTKYPICADCSMPSRHRIRILIEEPKSSTTSYLPLTEPG